MEQKNRDNSAFGFIAVLMSFIWIIVAKTITFYVGKAIADIFVIQTTGLLAIGIIMGIVYKENAKKKTLSSFPALFWPLIYLGSAIEGWIYTIWLSLISMLLLLQGISIGEKIKNKREQAIRGNEWGG